VIAVTWPERSRRSVCSVTEAQPAGGQALGATAAAQGRFRLASVMAAVLGVLGLVLMAAWVLLTFLTRDIQISRDGAAMAAGLACGLAGMLAARRQPRNPEGWLLLGVAVGVFFVVDSGLYAVLDYRLHDGRLPLGEVDLNGTYTGPGSPSGVLGVLAATSAGILLVPLFWPVFAARQALSWRRASGNAASSSSG
jgi:hypothetical protein